MQLKNFNYHVLKKPIAWGGNTMHFGIDISIFRTKLLQHGYKESELKELIEGINTYYRLKTAHALRIDEYEVYV
jgi:hypothetical protein